MRLEYRLLLWVLVTGADAVSFRVEPSQQTVVVGQTVTLRCQVDNQDGIHVYWGNVVTGDRVSEDRTIDPLNNLGGSIRRRYRIVGDPRSGEYNLMIRRIYVSDDSRYACFYTTDTNHSSQVARIRVLRYPDRWLPSCLMGPKLQVEVGDNITLGCESKDSKPPVTLTWVRGKQILQSTFITDPARIFADFGHTLTEADRDVRFTCVARSQALVQPRSCYVIPLRTRISVSLRPVVKTIDQGDSVSFNCISENVARLDYHWTVNGNPITESTPGYVLLRAGMKLKIPKATLQDDATVVICQVEQKQLGLTDQAVGRLRVRQLKDNVSEFPTVPVSTTAGKITTTLWDENEDNLTEFASGMLPAEQVTATPEMTSTTYKLPTKPVTPIKRLTTKPISVTDRPGAGVAAGMIVMFLCLLLVGVCAVIYFFRFRKRPQEKRPQE